MVENRFAGSSAKVVFTLLSRGMVTSVNDTKCAVNLPVNVETDVCKLLKP